MMTKQKMIKFSGFVFSLLLLGLGWYNYDTIYLKEIQRNGYVPTSSFQETIKQVNDEVVIGFWDMPDKLLVAKKFKQGYFLIQRDPGANYIVPRGKNLLQDFRTVISNKNFKLSLIKSENSELGGLFPPNNFPYDELKGYNKNEEGEWVKQKTTAVETTTYEPQGIVKYKLPISKNSTDWTQFSDITLPTGIYNVGGYGFPLYKDEKLQNGKINLFSKGFTQVINLDGLPRKTWEGKNRYFFNQLYYMIKVAARNMVNDKKNGGKYGNIKAIADLPDAETNIPYNNVTIEGAKELGKYLFSSFCCANSVDDQRWNIPTNDGVIMIDEESMQNYKWAGGESYAFYGYVNQGIMEKAGPNYKTFWYSQPIQRWLHANASWGVSHLSEKTIEGAFREQNILMDSPGWKNSSWFVDANGGYSKVPFLTNVDIYEKENGKFTFDKNGKRIFRNENFNMSIYGQEFSILARPDEFIRYNLRNSRSGERKFGRENVDIKADGSASIKRELVKQGFEWDPNGMSRPYPQYWEPETKMWVDGIYRRADGIMADLLMLGKLEKGVWDITKANVKHKLYGEHRPRTEPWTFGGNSVKVREVGESQIFYDTFMLLLSGGQAASSWDDGHYRTDLPSKGNPLYGEIKDNKWVYYDDYWARYHSKLAAVQTVMKPLEGSKVSDWTYIHFYYPFWGQKNSEVISSGIYFKGKLYVFFLNPTLENGEKQNLTLRAGSFFSEIELVGHEVYYKVFDVPSGLNAIDFKLYYTTIYGRKVRVNGKVTNKISEHYE